MSSSTDHYKHTETEQIETERGVYDDGYLRIEYDNYFVVCNGQRIKMSVTAFLILAYLSKTPNGIISYEALWEVLWGYEKPFNLASLKATVYQLRRLIKPFNIKIEVLVNTGYRFAPVNKDEIRSE